MKAWMAVLGAAALAGCGGGDNPHRKAADDAHDVALVERLNEPPFKPVLPQSFTREDIARYDLARVGCMFRPGNKPDEPPLFVAQQDRGYLKIEGKLRPLAVKSGSAELPSGAHSTYIGTSHWIELVAQAGDEGRASDGGKAWPSRLVIHDANERVAFDSLGQVSCAKRAE
ncbi:hypothetical protein HNO88_000014 [Novosphingobium chloroacetimidivorans]|uniref:Lipoprotein n=1 Tax=Novosphingobium chloroacetimidivorans TaxID=1428314 RepID=A0A7W7NV51_9SPHN|nr:hypothetical protein [Novosphingobium chloroacetimidivorans]MBB4856717.1 hypothetical protein [Novosphingobium chloroacetimidivorans]